jgi:hypothetical protein
MKRLSAGQDDLLAVPVAGPPGLDRPHADALSTILAQIVPVLWENSPI